MGIIFQKKYKNFNIFEFDLVDSTMNVAKNFEENTVILALEQTQGKGKAERIWFSENNGNLYFSLNILANNKNKDYSQLSFLTSVSMREAINFFDTSSKNKIVSKWPNDILINEEKCCGILLNLDGEHLIIGCGVNIKEPPKTSSNFNSTSLFLNNIMVEKYILLQEFLNIFLILFEDWQKNGFINIRKKWLKDCYKLNEKILIHDSGETIGIFENIDENGALILKVNNKEKKIIHSGDIFSK